MKDVFCQIVEGQIPSKKVYEDDDILAIEDIKPKARIHVVIFPKKHLSATINEEDSDVILEKVFKTVRKIAKDKKVDQTGYRVLSNHGFDAGQSVSHLHFHLLAGEQLKDI